MFKFFKWYCFYVDKIDTPNYSGQSTGHWGRFNSVLILLSCMYVYIPRLSSFQWWSLLHFVNYTHSSSIQNIPGIWILFKPNLLCLSIFSSLGVTHRIFGDVKANLFRHLE